jgi:hypothetical protein
MIGARIMPISCAVADKIFVYFLIVIYLILVRISVIT